jgi:hypothetical protein
MQTLPQLFLEDELTVVRKIFQGLHRSRDRNAIYAYLRVVYRLQKKWRRSVRRRRVLKMYKRKKGARAVDSLRFIVDATCTADRRSKWKYIRALECADYAGVDPKRLRRFLRHNDGINGTIELYAQLTHPDSDNDLPDWPHDIGA